jgi:Subtilase family
VISQAITQVRGQGVAYFTAGGNNANFAYDIPTDPTAPATTPLTASFNTTAAAGTQGAGEKLLNFDATRATQVPALHVTVPSMRPGDFLAVVVQWDQPFVTSAPNSGGATSQIDVCLLHVSGDTVADDFLNPLTNNCTGANAPGTDPLQVILVGNPATNTTNSAPATFDIQVGLANNTAAPNRIKVAVEGNGLNLTMSPFFTGTSPTIQGHSMSADAITVGAALYFDTPACGTTPATLEDYSSFGGDPTLFDAAGVRLATQQVRQKPDVVGPDGGSDTFLGQNIGAKTSAIAGCANGSQFPNFRGTSAATPHVAAVAALLLEADPSLSVDDLYTILQNSTLPMSPTSPNFASGFGFIQADLAAVHTPAVIPPAPALTLSSASTTVGASDTLTWTSSNNQGCTASGAWSGTQVSNGTMTIMPTAVGMLTYTLMCTNHAGISPAGSVTLNVTAAASGGGHGGGSMDLVALLALSGLLAGRAVVNRRARSQRTH